MQPNRLIAGLIAVIVIAGAASLLWQNNSADQAEGIDITAASPAPDLSEVKMANGTSPAPGLPEAKTLPDTTTSETDIASLDPLVQIENLFVSAPKKPSIAEADPRVSVTRTKIDPDAPRFDIVRIDTSGMAIIAGRGKPGSTVDILINKIVVATAPVENSGTFAIVLQTPMVAGVQKISLKSKIGTRDITGPEEVTVLIPDQVEKKKPLIVLSQPDLPSRVVQRPTPTGHGNGFSLDVVDYNEIGRMILSGTARSRAWVHVLLNTEALGQVQASNAGLWSLTSPVDVAPGRYTIHLEEWDGTRRKTRQASFPFERADLNKLVIADGEMIVQPGNNLWSIAKSNYGSGFKYTVIYAANAGKISNPDLIYPGQVFSLPNN